MYLYIFRLGRYIGRTSDSIQYVAEPREGIVHSAFSCSRVQLKIEPSKCCSPTYGYTAPKKRRTTVWSALNKLIFPCMHCYLKEPLRLKKKKKGWMDLWICKLLTAVSGTAAGSPGKIPYSWSPKSCTWYLCPSCFKINGSHAGPCLPPPTTTAPFKLTFLLVQTPKP